MNLPLGLAARCCLIQSEQIERLANIVILHSIYRSSAFCWLGEKTLIKLRGYAGKCVHLLFNILQNNQSDRYTLDIKKLAAK